MGQRRLDRRRTPCISASSLKTGLLAEVCVGAVRMAAITRYAVIARSLACTKPLAMIAIPPPITTKINNRHCSRSFAFGMHSKICHHKLPCNMRVRQLFAEHVIHAGAAFIRHLDEFTRSVREWQLAVSARVNAAG